MSNFLAEVIQTRDAVSGDEFRDLLQNVGSKLTTLKTDLVESLHSTFVLSESDIDKVTSWYVEILSTQEKVEDLQQKFHDDRKALQSATEDIDYLEDELQHNERGILLLKTLIEIVRNIEKADSVEFYKASKLVKLAERGLHDILEKFQSDEDHGWIVGLKSSICDLKIDVYEKASKELRSVFHFHFGKNTLTINKKFDIDQLIETLINIGYCSRVVNKLAADIWQELLVKACSQDYYIEISGNGNTPVVPVSTADAATVPVRDTDPSCFQRELPSSYNYTSVITIKAVKTAKPITNVEGVFNNIRNVLRVFKDIFSESMEIMTEFSTILGPKICEELGNKCLKNLILRNADGDIDKARNNIAVMNNFIEDFESSLNFTVPETGIFYELANDFDTLFLNQVKQDLLVKIRSLVKGSLYDTQEILYENPDSSIAMPEEMAALHRNPFAFPKCVVSKTAVEIVNTLKDHLNIYKDDVAMCDAAFNLYLSLVKIPKHESESGDLVPFSAVLVHNNSLYLAHHACFTFFMTEDKVPELRLKASQAYAFMMRTVRTKLNSMISDAMTGILNTDDSSEDEVNNFLRISSEFVRLHGMLQYVLPSQTLSRTLATFVDHTVNEMCSKVLAWDDISASCANKLASVFTQFSVETSDLFKGEASNIREIEALTAKCVSKWNRFRLLTFVLTASMKEIEDKWVEGCGPLAVEFKADELRKLIRALFQNTDRRAAFLASIK